MTYRPDIDGLRAMAVLLVLAFHGGVPFLPGGFVGVDVFFVISGYLITGLLLDEFQRNGDISLWGFWARRVRRLAPALVLTLATVMLAASVFMSRIGGETGPVAKAAMATLLLNANHFFLLDAGDYFAAAAETNPLLHMWSLSVEEQFYLFWPVLLLVLLRRRAWKNPFAVVSGLLAISLVFGVMATLLPPEAAFYLMPARAWELLAGAALAAFLVERRLLLGNGLAAILGLTGLSMIFFPALRITGSAHFPFPLALLPVAGAVLLLLAGAANPGNLVSRLGGSGALVYVGKISYPLYLWHWPALVMLRSQRLYEPSPALDVLALGVSFVLAVFTYEMVERRSSPWFSSIGSSRKVVALGVVATVGLFGGAGLLGAWARLGWGYSDQDRGLAAARMDFPQTGCIFASVFPDSGALEACFPKKAGLSVLLWGDSHAAQWGPALKPASEKVGANLGILALGGCLPLPGAELSPHCAQFHRQVFRSLPEWRRDRGLSGIVLAGRWAHEMGFESPTMIEKTASGATRFFDVRAKSTPQALAYFEASLSELLNAAAREELRVLIVLPSPIQKYKGPHCLSVWAEKDCFVTLDEMTRYAGAVEAVIRKVVAGNPHVRVIDPKKFLCKDARCPAMLDGSVAYTDPSHLSNTVSQASASYFLDDLAWLARRDLGLIRKIEVQNK